MYSEIVKNLSGHSGCKVQLCCSATGNVWFVRKISASVNYNPRLISQARKQRFFEKVLKDQFMTVPKVYDDGYLGNLYFFDMEYVAGTTLANKLSHLSPDSIFGIVKHFNKVFVKSEFRQPCDNANLIFQNKIESLEKKLQSKDSIFTDAVGVLKGIDFSGIDKSLCFGDLSLENIIITQDGELVVIDLLDTFFDSYLLDISKALFDIEYGWSFRNHVEDANLSVRRLIAKEYIHKLFNTSEMAHLAPLMLLTALRIVPYTKSCDSKSVELLRVATNKILNQLRV